MRITYKAVCCPGQDGAIYGDYLFRFSNNGICRVFSIKELKEESDAPATLPQLALFTLDRASEISPHSNAVVFGNEFLFFTRIFTIITQRKRISSSEFAASIG